MRQAQHEETGRIVALLDSDPMPEGYAEIERADVCESCGAPEGERHAKFCGCSLNQF
jgi:hypothetical protein